VACDLCPVNFYCLGGQGAAAVATPCPGTSTTNGVTAAVSVTACVQGRFWQIQSTLPAQNMTVAAQYQEAAAATVRFVASNNGILLGSGNGGGSWSTTGPFPGATNRTWLAIETCPFTLVTPAAEAYGVVGLDSAGVMWAGAATAPAIPTVWTQLVNASSNNVPTLDGPIISIACAGVRSLTNTRSTFTVIVATRTSVWLAISDATNAVPVSGQMLWKRQNVAVAGTVFSSVAGTLVGTRTGGAVDQTAVYAVAFNGGVSTANFPAPSALLTEAPALTWSSVVATLPSLSADFVSVSLGADFSANTPAFVKIATAVRGGGVFSSDGAAASWNTLSTFSGDWKKVQYTTVGVTIDFKVLALLNNGTVFVTNGPPTAGSLVPVVGPVMPALTALINAGNGLGRMPMCVDAVVSVGGSATTAPVTCVTGAVPAYYGNTTYSGIVTTTSTAGTWEVTADSNPGLWLAMAAGQTSGTVVAIDDIDGGNTGARVWVSKTGGTSWKVAATYTTADCTGVACDAECTKIAIICDTKVLFSTNGGLNFVISTATLTAGTLIAMSPDGLHVYVPTTGTSVQVSTDTNTFTGFVTRASVVTNGIASIAAANNGTAVIGTTGANNNVVLTRDAFVTAPVAITTTPALGANGPWTGTQISADGRYIATFGDVSNLLYTVFCNGTTSACINLPNNLPSGIGVGAAVDKAAIGMTANGERLVVASATTGQASRLFTATLISGAYNNFPASAAAAGGPTAVYGAVAASASGGLMLAAAAVGDIYQAFG
jgi:hypothetical protein